MEAIKILRRAISYYAIFKHAFVSRSAADV